MTVRESSAAALFLVLCPLGRGDLLPPVLEEVLPLGCDSAATACSKVVGQNPNAATATAAEMRPVMIIRNNVNNSISPLMLLLLLMLLYPIVNKKHLKNVGPIRHCEPPHAHSPGVATVARRHCRTPFAHRCPRQRQRQRVTGDRYDPIEWAQSAT